MARVLAFVHKPQSVSNFTVRITDDSLTGAGIHKNHVLEVHRTDEFQTGDLVAVTTPDGFFVSFIDQEACGQLLLRAAHPAYPALRYPLQEVIIQGVVLR